MKSLKSRAFDVCVRVFEKSIRLLGPAAYWKIMPLLIERVDLWYPIQTSRGMLRMHCGGEIARVRAAGFHSVEPETLEWIDGFADSDTLLDIGANVGVYTLYASFVRNIHVVAVEPSPFSFVELARNILANGLSEKVVAIPAAAAERGFVADMNYASVSLKSGGSGASFDTALDNAGGDMGVAAKLQQPGFSIDEIVTWSGVRFPNHIKIDVIGNQGRILVGAKKTLADPRMKSLMVEMPLDLPDEDRLARETLAAAGFEQTVVVRHNNTFFVRRGS